MIEHTYDPRKQVDEQHANTQGAAVTTPATAAIAHAHVAVATPIPAHNRPTYRRPVLEPEPRKGGTPL